MIQRKLLAEAQATLERQPAIVITGPRQVGKTTLAQLLVANLADDQKLLLDLERTSDRRRLTDPEAFLSRHAEKCIVLDEAQLMPELFSALRPLIDADRRPGRFIITGSASPSLVQGLSESLAGRVAYLELRPIGAAELPGTIPQDMHWFRGGFPPALLADSDEDAVAWLDDFIQSYITRDLARLFGVQLSASIVGRFWRMLAVGTSGVWNGESYARALGITGPTVARYLDYLEGAFLVQRLQPWHTNTRKRLVRSPKVYVRDSGLVHRLADIASLDSLLSTTLAGGSWEGYAIAQITTALPGSVQPYFFRTQDGAEADLVLVHRGKPWACIEIKLGASAVPARGFYESLKALGPKHAWCVTSAVDGESYPLSEGVDSVGLGRFVNEVLPAVLPK